MREKAIPILEKEIATLTKAIVDFENQEFNKKLEKHLRDCEKTPAVLEALEQMGIKVKTTGVDQKDAVIVGTLVAGSGVVTGMGIAAVEFVSLQVSGRVAAGAVIGGVLAGVFVTVATVGYLGIQSSWSRKEATKEIADAMKLEMRNR